MSGIWWRWLLLLWLLFGGLGFFLNGWWLGVLVSFDVGGDLVFG